MKRTIRGLLAGLLMLGAFVLMPASPAAAQDVCVGQGTAVTGEAVFYPVVGPPVETSFDFELDLGICVPSGNASLSADGNISGPLGGAHCGLSDGSGTTDTGHDFEYTGVGSMLILHGPEVFGVVNAVPDALAEQSCIGGAEQFIVTGAAALV